MRSGLLTSSTGHWNVIARFTFTAAKKPQNNKKKQGTYTDVSSFRKTTKLCDGCHRACSVPVKS